jgi:NAD-dependent deacetylase
MSPADPSSPVRRVASPPTADPRTVSERLEVAARALRAAEHVCVLTGAGISAESGVPTFRDAMTGLWSKYDPQDLATPEAFARDPKLVWRWYAARAATVRAAQPNDAHRALVTLQRFVGHVTLVTQNVDDLHVRAGSQGIIALHGSLLAARCSAGCAGTVEADYSRKSPPRCPTCGALMRPDVVWFGEQLPSAALEAARTATLACDVFLSVGTSNLVEPAASLPWLAAAHGATVIVVNPDMRGQRTGPSIIPLAGPAGLLLPRLVAEAFRGRRPRHRDGGDPADPVALDEVTSKAG